MVCLVTTSVESTFSSKDQMLFLGKWCLKYDNELNNSSFKKKNTVVKNNLNDEIYRKESFFNSVEIKARILKKLVVFLNNYHNLNLNEREWNIILGHWLQKYVDTIYNRFDSIIKLIEQYKFDYTIVLSQNKFDFFVENSADFTNATNNEYWNHFLYYEILKYNNIQKFKFIDSEEVFSTCEKSSSTIKIRLIIKKFLTKFSFLFTRRNKLFISNSYLPFKYEVLLNFSFHQLFGYFLTPSIKKSGKVDYQIRLISLASDNTKGVEGFIFQNVLRFIPKTFLEDFVLNFKLSNNFIWPTKPKIIFISNNFDTDDLFKFYIVNKINNYNTKYVVGQHGAHYGTTLQYEYYPEYQTSDFFITWGWKNRNSDLIGFNFKTTGLFNSYKKNCQIKYLMLNMPILHQNVLWDVYEFQDRYQEDQFRFISNLDSDVKCHLEIKLHSEHTKKIWFEKERFLQFDNSLKFSSNNYSILKLFLESKIVIHTYDSTGILECLSMNVPMIAFWSQDVYLLNDKAKTMYDEMIKSRIFFNNPSDASTFLNRIKGNVFEWWTSSTVQNARLQFCDYYCKVERNPIFTLKSTLNFE